MNARQNNSLLKLRNLANAQHFPPTDTSTLEAYAETNCVSVIRCDNGMAIFHDTTTLCNALRQHYPLLTVRYWSPVMYERAICDWHKKGCAVQLYEDANDLAGVSEHAADRAVDTV